jgi:hypothetical protein
MDNMPTSVNRVLEKHWSALPLFDRAKLLIELGVDGKNKEILGGKTMDQIIQSGQDDLPGEVRGRLILAVTDVGFTKEEYERVKTETRRTASNRERGN